MYKFFSRNNLHPHPLTSFHSRVIFIAALTLPVILLTLIEPPIAQDPSYHRFADQHSWLGIPNFANVASNLGFLIVGVLGMLLMHRLWRQPDRRRFIELREMWPYVILFTGIALTSFGSAYYHLAPNDKHLVLDRLPITLAFMSLFASVIMERINIKAGLSLLPLLIWLGIWSVIYWYWGDIHGGGDLRLYVDVQFYPLIAVPLIVMLFPPRYVPDKYLIPIIGLYILSKVFEVYDKQVYALLYQTVSGHTLKHLVSSLATAVFIWVLRHRMPAISSSNQSPVSK